MDGLRLWQESADARQRSLHLLFSCVVLVCKPKLLPWLRFKNYALCVCWSTLEGSWCSVEKLPLNAVGSLLGYFGGFFICISSL
jgi:hypothetical protein